MIKCGTDIIEIDRIKDAIEKEGFKKRVYTEKEIEYCESKNVQKYQSYSGRFAAKEAIFKALSILIEDKYKIKWTDFEIINDEEGKPNVQINTDIIDKSLIKNIDISISHCKEYATAVCIIEINN
ncbi:MAG: holo-ACP synthase [Clostridium sp.]|nr:holo-ACP synthase [Clostridium sp.]